MADDERDATGRYAQQYPDEAFVHAVEEREPAGTSEIAEAVGCTTQNADYRLKRLERDGSVSSKNVGGSLVWTAEVDHADENSSAHDVMSHRDAASTFFDRVRTRLGDDIIDGYLFGSVAREAETTTSDVDVLVVVDADADFQSVDDQLLAIAYDVGLEFGVPIEVHPIQEREFVARQERGEPFVRRVLEEGRAVG